MALPVRLFPYDEGEICRFLRKGLVVYYARLNQLKLQTAGGAQGNGIPDAFGLSSHS